MADVDISRLSRDFSKEPWKKRIDVPVKEDIEYLYCELNLPADEICAFMGFSGPTLSRALREFNLKKTAEQKKESRKKIFIEKFGSPSPLGNPEIRKSIEDNFEKKYGTRKIGNAKEVIEKRKKTNQARYGGNSPMCSEEVREKSKQTSLENWGVDNPQKNKELKQKNIADFKAHTGYVNPGQIPEIKDKIKKSVQKHYGEQYSSALQVPEVIDKITKTNLEKYGVKNPFESKIIQNKAKNTLLNKYGVQYISQLHLQNSDNITKEYWENNFINNKGCFCVTDCAIYHNMSIWTVKEYLKKFDITVRLKYESRGERDIRTFFGTEGYEAKKDRTILGGKELDIYVKALNLAIEYDGLLYHSTYRNYKFRTKADTVKSNYHLRKTIECSGKGIKLLHVIDNEWNNPLTRQVWLNIFNDNMHKTKGLPVQVAYLESANNEFFNKNSLISTVNNKFINAEVDGSVVASCSIEATESMTVCRVAVAPGYSLVGCTKQIYTYIRNNVDKEAFLLIDNRYESVEDYPELVIANEIKPRLLYAETPAQPLNILEDDTPENILILHKSGNSIMYDCGLILLR